MGDFNCNLARADLSTTQNLLQLLQLANTGIQSQELRPTRISLTSSSCLDFIAVDHSLLISDYSVSDFLISDHHPITASFCIPLQTTLNPIIKRSFKATNFLELGTRLDNIQLLPIYDAHQLDEQLSVWHTNVISLLDEFAPFRQYPRVKKVTWVNRDTRALIRLRSSCSRKLRNGLDINVTGQCLDQIKSLNRQIKSRIRATLKNQAGSALANKQSKKAWNFIRKATFSQPKGSNSNQLPEISVVNNYFGDLVSSDPSQMTTPIDLTSLASNSAESSDSLDSNDMFDIHPLDIYSTFDLLHHVKADSAMGPDNIPAFLLRKWAVFIAHNIMHLFNASIAIGAFPTEWKKANVLAVYKKKGAKSEVSNYRPISILSILGRLLERAVASQLQLYCDHHNIIPVQQFGFRKNSSCELSLLVDLDNWQNEASLGHLVGTLLIDLAKAFDSVSHPILLSDLANVGCS